MSSYQVLARKYRPKNFDQLVDQEVIKTTLLNFIQQKRIPHAFILTGIRGVGKTTTARIIAKSLNCLGEKNNTVLERNPCTICTNCISIDEGNFQDVIEIDAASRTGVEDIREIINNSGYLPSQGKYKIFIIDEIHMLSNNAFNALLKTLEEPPFHVKFIFATTEIRKVPITVISRCQRFDLKRIDHKYLVEYLKTILVKEEFESDEESLNLISTVSEGSLRDALTILDNVLSFNNYKKKLEYDSTIKIIGANNQEDVLELYYFIIFSKTKEALDKFDSLYKNSIDISLLIHDLLELNHEFILHITAQKKIKFFNYSKKNQEIISLLVKESSLSKLVKIYQILINSFNEIKYLPNIKSIFEITIIKLSYSNQLSNLDKIIFKFQKLNESQIKEPKSELNSKTSKDFIKPEKIIDNGILLEEGILKEFPGAKKID